MYVYDKVSFANVTTSTNVGYWDVGGFSEVFVCYWFQGPVTASAYLTGYFSGLESFGFPVKVSPAGYASAQGRFPIYGPELHLELYNPSAPLTGFASIYLSCCGSTKTTKSMAMSEAASRQLEVPSDRILLPPRDGIALATES